MPKGILYISAVVLFFVGYVKYIEARGIYFPMREIEFTPEYVGLSFEDVYIDTQDDIKLNGWFIPCDNARYTVLFFHGNAGNIGHRLDKLTLLHRLQLNLFIIDYRGYGRSQGRPGEKGIYLDAKAAYDYLVNKRKISPEEIILYGESLGCAAVVHLAASEKVKALIVEGAFTRGKDMAKRIYPFLPAFLFANSYDSLSKIERVKAAKLFIHSKNDEVVPLGLAKQLYGIAKEPKKFAEIWGGHNSAFLDAQQEYISSIKSFVGQLAAQE